MILIFLTMVYILYSILFFWVGWILLDCTLYIRLRKPILFAIPTRTVHAKLIVVPVGGTCTPPAQCHSSSKRTWRVWDSRPDSCNVVQLDCQLVGIGMVLWYVINIGWWEQQVRACFNMGKDSMWSSCTTCLGSAAICKLEALNSKIAHNSDSLF